MPLSSSIILSTHTLLHYISVCTYIHFLPFCLFVMYATPPACIVLHSCTCNYCVFSLLFPPTQKGTPPACIVLHSCTCNYCVFSLLFPPTQKGNPLGIAAEKGHSQTVQRLMKAGAITNHQNKVMVTWCCSVHYDTCVEKEDVKSG